MDNDGIYVGNIQSRFNNGGGYQYIHIPIDKRVHDLLQLPLRHLPMGKGHIGIRHQFFNGKSHFRNILHSIIDVIDLTSSGHLPHDGFPHHFRRIFHNIGLDGHTIHGRFLQNAHIPDTHQTHVQGSWNRCRRQSQHIHIVLHLLDLFFMCHTKTLFFVNDQQSQIFEFDIG